MHESITVEEPPEDVCKEDNDNSGLFLALLILFIIMTIK